LGGTVHIAREWTGEPCDALIALHARKSAPSIRRYASAHPDRPLLVALTGTDLYHDLPRSPAARRSVEAATLLLVLQPLAVRSLPAPVRRKVRVIPQSAVPTRPKPSRSGADFVVCVAGHLRWVKDPLRAAYAARLLPPTSRIRVEHYGAVLEPRYRHLALRESERNPRYRWLGPLPHEEFRRRLAASDVIVLSSRLEGGANIISEAVADEVPVLASRVAGNVGLLGSRYPGYFPPVDTKALARLLHRTETEPSFRRRLLAHIKTAARQLRPVRERSAWQQVVRELELER
jgi:putative glycosyltransferase (TIGR04348 family)